MHQEAQARHLLMIPLPRALQVRIEDRFLPSIGASRPSMGYHITVLGPFFVTAEEPEQILPAIAESCAASAPMRISLQHVDVFENAADDHAVYISVRPLWALRRLHRRLYQALQHQVKAQYTRLEPYRPHITLGLNLPAQSRDILLRSAHEPFEALFEADEIWLMEQGPQGPWQPLFAFRLGQHQEPRPLGIEHSHG